MTDFLLLHEPGHGAWTWDGVKGFLDNALRQESRLYHAMYTPGILLAPDLPSGVPPEDLTLDRWADDVLRQANAAGIKQPVVVAHSLAGLLALEVARRLGKRTQGIVLVGAVVPDMFHTVMETLPLHIRLLLQVLRLVPGYKRGDTLRLHREVVLKLMCNDMSYPLASQCLGRLTPIPLRPLDALPHLDALEPACPVTYIVLQRDRLVPPKLQRRMAASIPEASTVELDAGHEAPVFRAEQVAMAILETAGMPVSQAA